MLSIGVTAATDLPKLNGAGRSAAAISAWGELQGYSTALITDDKTVDPEATDVTATRVKEALERLIGDGGQDRILISFAGHGLRRDGAEELWLLNNWKSAPGGINHIALRDRLESYLPKQIGFISDVCRTLPTSEARRVEGSAIIDYKEYKEASIQTVTLNGTLAAQPAFSTPTENDDQYCFFSKVVYDALRGEYSTNANELSHNDLVRILRNEVPQLVSRYKRTQIPDPRGNFDSPNQWSDFSIDMSSLAPLDLPEPAPPATSPNGVPKGGEVFLGSNLPNMSIASTIDNLTRIKAQSLHEQILHAEQSQWPHLVVAGAKISAVTVEKGFNLLDTKKRDGNAVYTKRASTLLIQMEHGDYAGAAMYDHMRTLLVVNETGVESLSIEYRGFNNDFPVEENARASLGERFTNPSDIAANLRENKHANPVLGIQAAYAYASLGETDDIRRTAYYYANASQPLPFDIALLGKVKVYFRDNILFAIIPSVVGRDPKSEVEQSRPYTHSATPEIECRVAGVFPWMRQGWAFVESNRNESIRDLTVYRDGLLGSMYTTLSNKAGKKLSEYIEGI